MSDRDLCYDQKVWDDCMEDYKEKAKDSLKEMLEMEDSGKREQFSTGSVRDTAKEKSRPDLISPFAKDRLGQWLRLGSEKYEERNWEAGIPISRCLASLERHLMYYQQGDTSEDHASAIMCNIMFIIHYEEMIKRGVLPPELNDMPDYGEK